MKNVIYVDGIGRLSVGKGVCQLELLNMTELDEKSAGKLECNTRLAMSVDTILHLQQTLGGVVEKLKEKGIVVQKGEQH
mgnify:CR=1 FL=1